jgi:hypothetical protein
MQPRVAAWLILLMATGTLAGCATPGPGAAAGCVVDSQRKATIVELFFGRDMPNGRQVSDAAWDAFAAGVISPAFPNGFTVYDAQGEWRNPNSSRVVQEKTKVLQIALTQDHAGQLQAIMQLYREKFSQISVGIISYAGCAAF